MIKYDSTSLITYSTSDVDFTILFFDMQKDAGTQGFA